MKENKLTENIKAKGRGRKGRREVEMKESSGTSRWLKETHDGDVDGQSRLICFFIALSLSPAHTGARALMSFK